MASVVEKLCVPNLSSSDWYDEILQSMTSVLLMEILVRTFAGFSSWPDFFFLMRSCSSGGRGMLTSTRLISAVRTYVIIGESGNSFKTFANTARNTIMLIAPFPTSITRVSIHIFNFSFVLQFCEMRHRFFQGRVSGIICFGTRWRHTWFTWLAYVPSLVAEIYEYVIFFRFPEKCFRR